MNNKILVGFRTRTDHPLDEPLSLFMQQNGVWMAEQDGVMSFEILRKPWAEAIVLVTAAEDDAARDAQLREEVNGRLIAAGFKTNLPTYDRRPDGHLIKDRPAVTIEILSVSTRPMDSWTKN